MNQSAMIEREVEALVRLDLEGLREEWRRRWGPPPKLRSVQFLQLMIAWRIQVEAFGGVDYKTRTALLGGSNVAAIKLEPGARLAREWKGERHEVAVTPEGFIYGGETYRSLSEIARLITGSRWNGLRFFGLRQ